MAPARAPAYRSGVRCGRAIGITGAFLSVIAACGGVTTSSAPGTSGTSGAGGATGGAAGTSAAAGAPASGGSGGAPPPGCSLAVIASGKLPGGGAGTMVTGPAIAAAPTAFVVAYRVQDTATGDVEVDTLAVSDDGVLYPPSPATLPGCASALAVDGIGLAFSGDTGLCVAGLADCSGSGAGAAFIPVDALGTVGTPTVTRNPSFSSLVLAQRHALSKRADATSPDGTVKPAFDFVYTAMQTGQQQTQIATLAGDTFADTPASLFPNAADYGMVATTGSTRAVLGRVPAQASDVFSFGPGAPILAPLLAVGGHRLRGRAPGCRDRSPPGAAQTRPSACCS